MKNQNANKPKTLKTGTATEEMQKNEATKKENILTILIENDRLKFFHNDILVNEDVLTPEVIQEINNMGRENYTLLLTNYLREEFKNIPIVFIPGNQKIK